MECVFSGQCFNTDFDMNSLYLVLCIFVLE